MSEELVPFTQPDNDGHHDHDCDLDHQFVYYHESSQAESPSGTMSPHEHVHLYAVEKRRGTHAAGHVLRPEERAHIAFRTTPTAAIAMSDWDADAQASQASSDLGTDDDYHMHDVLLSVSDILEENQKIVMGVALEHDLYFTLVSNEDTGQTAILGLQRKRRSAETFEVHVVVPVLAKSTVKLDGDGGLQFAPTVPPGAKRRTYVFKPASVRSLWSAFHTLLKTLESNDSLRPDESWPWLHRFHELVEDEEDKLARWSFISERPLSELEQIRLEQKEREELITVNGGPRLEEEFEKQLIKKLKEIMFASDLDTITSKQLLLGLEQHFGQSLKHYKHTINQQMITIMGQMEAASKIFDYLYLGTEWNASNKDELEANNCRFVLNVTHEIPNFFVDSIEYYNVRIWDVPTEDIWPHWENTFRFIRQAREAGSSVLVHCKMGVSRSASTVIAYAMKQHNWSLEEAHAFVKKRRRIIKPNEGFKQQLVLYEGILRAKRESGSWGAKVGRRQHRLLFGIHQQESSTDDDSPNVQATTIRRVTPPESPLSTPPGSPTPSARNIDIDPSVPLQENKRREGSVPEQLDAEEKEEEEAKEGEKDDHNGNDDDRATDDGDRSVKPPRVEELSSNSSGNGNRVAAPAARSSEPVEWQRVSPRAATRGTRVEAALEELERKRLSSCSDSGSHSPPALPQRRRSLSNSMSTRERMHQYLQRLDKGEGAEQQQQQQQQQQQRCGEREPESLAQGDHGGGGGGRAVNHSGDDGHHLLALSTTEAVSGHHNPIRRSTSVDSSTASWGRRDARQRQQQEEEAEAERQGKQAMAASERVKQGGDAREVPVQSAATSDRTTPTPVQIQHGLADAVAQQRAGEQTAGGEEDERSEHRARMATTHGTLTYAVKPAQAAPRAVAGQVARSNSTHITSSALSPISEAERTAAVGGQAGEATEDSVHADMEASRREDNDEEGDVDEREEGSGRGVDELSSVAMSLTGMTAQSRRRLGSAVLRVKRSLEEAAGRCRQPESSPALTEADAALSHALDAVTGLIHLVTQHHDSTHHAASKGPQDSAVTNARLATVAGWKVADVVAWAEGCYGVAPFACLFGEHGLCGRDLLDLTHADLESMGIHRLHDRKVLFRAIQRLLNEDEELEVDA